MVMERGQMWWAALPAPSGTRPVLILQANAFNRSSIQTVVVVVLTSNLVRANDPGNVLVTAAQSGLPKDSVVNASQMFTMNKESLREPIGHLPARLLRDVENGIRMVLGL
jgi:mRNA interferase MazF